MYPDTDLFIDGRWIQAQSGQRIAVVNPATGNAVGSVAHAGPDELDAALASASLGFTMWRAVSAFERSRLMRRAAELLRERSEAIARIMTVEQGKPVGEARAETLAGADIIDWFAEEARRVYGRVIPARAGNVRQLVLKDPVGPVAAFTPWNFPINQAVRKLSASLAAGCSVILKGPEETPASCAALVRAFADAGLPAGVISLVFGDPAEISARLIADPAIAKVSFTGSVAVGKRLAALAGRHMKRVTMELGGHAPVIVCADADIDQAASILSASKFRNAGQVCVAPTRFMVHSAVHDAFLARFVRHAGEIVLGDGLREEVGMGPLANARRLDAMESLVADALAAGAVRRLGGSRVGNIGNFYAPTILSEVPLQARAMHEEPFGPLALVTRFSDLDAAIAEANRLPFGLAAYGYTRSAAHAARLSAELQAGMLSINHYGLGLPETPFGGLRESGYGSEGGSEAMESYLNTRLVTQAF